MTGSFIRVAALLLAPAIAAAAGGGVTVEELRRRRRPFAWEAARACADYVRVSARGMVDAGPEGVVTGLAGVLLSAPMALLAPAVDLAAWPFRRRVFVRYTLNARLVDETGGPVRQTPVLAEAVGWRATMGDLAGYEVFRGTRAARTDEDGWFELSGDGFFGPNQRILLRLWAGQPAHWVQALCLSRRRGRIRAVAEELPSGPLRLMPELGDSGWED